MLNLSFLARHLKRIIVVLSRNVALVLLFPFYVPILVFIRIFRSQYPVRIGTLFSSRMGHFVSDAGRYHAELSLPNNRSHYLFWMPQRISNLQWEKMIRRNLYVSWWVYFLDRYNSIIPGGEQNSFSGTRDLFGVIEKNKAPIPFLQDEDARVKDWLTSKGWKVGEPIVCFLVRDSAYLDQSPLTSTNGNSNHWRYHDYRDSDVANYEPAMQWLADQGVWVFRMGKIMHKPLSCHHPRIIDYPFLLDKDDLYDVWLFAHCALCVSTGTGIDAVSLVYRRPILSVDLIPIKHMWTMGDVTVLPKLLIDRATGSILSLNEYLLHSYQESEKYDLAGIDVVGNTSSHIMASVRDRWIKINGGRGALLEKENSFFLSTLLTHPASSGLHGWVHPNAGISPVFLEAFPEWL